MVIGVRELGRKVSQVLDSVEEGEEVVVTRHWKPVAKIVPYEKSRKDAVFADLVARGVLIPGKQGKMDPPEPVLLTEGTVADLLDK